MSKETIEELERRISSLQCRLNLLTGLADKLKSVKLSEESIDEGAYFDIYVRGDMTTMDIKFICSSTRLDGRSVSVTIDRSEYPEIKRLVSDILSRERDRAERALALFSGEELK